MPFDLLRASLAALAVGVVPGWFWARTLVVSPDRAERLAYSVALSITLVPTAMLLQMRLLGTGATLAIVVASTLGVFLTGLASYLIFGAAKGPEEPLIPLPAPLGVTELLLLAPAFGLMLATIGGLVPLAWGVPPAGALVLLAGISYAFNARRDASEPAPGSQSSPADRGGSGLETAIRRLLLSAVLLAVLARGYLGPLWNGWPFPRGVDRYEHDVMTGMMLSDGSTESFMLYPPGFHLLMAAISRLSGMEALGIFPALAPALPLLTALACYALARRLWGWRVGVAAALFSGLILGGPYLHFVEARYPNSIGEMFLVVLTVAALAGLYAAPSPRSVLLLALLGSSTVLYHQISSFVTAVLLAVVAAVFLPYLVLRDRTRGLALFASLALLGTFAVAYAWDTYDLGRLMIGLVGGSASTGRGGDAVAMAIGTKPVFPIGHLIETTTQPVVWLGMLGLILALVGLLVGRGSNDTSPGPSPGALAGGALILWCVLLFVGSRTSLAAFPDRFERDFGVPLAIFAALALVTLVRSLGFGAGRSPRIVLAASLGALVLAGAVVGLQSGQNLVAAAGPSERPKDRPAPGPVAAAGRWLEENNGGGSILATPYLDYVPSRGMLAMGGYTTMQSYDAARIRRDRDLPPFGAKPLWDSLWALQHPRGEKTQQILRDNKVRYIVFHKRYPGVSWRSFAQYPGLYHKAFENGSVVIFAPREV